MLFLDVQGAEYQILSSVSAGLLQQIRLIYTEASQEEVYQGGRNLDEIRSILAEDFTFLGFAPLTNACPTHGNALFVNRRDLTGIHHDSSTQPSGETGNIQSLLLAGFTHLEHRQWEGALSAFGRALDLAPQRQGLHFLRGRCLMELNRAEEAVRALEAELDIQPNHPDARQLLSQARQRLSALPAGQSNQQRALSLCEQASQLWPAGKAEAALELLNAALQLEKSLLGAHYGQALCLEQMGRIDEAEAAVRQEILLQPDHQEARKLFHSLRIRRRAARPARQHPPQSANSTASSGQAPDSGCSFDRFSD
jgi:tetratricopeptide (TPR) repeat protein